MTEKEGWGWGKWQSAVATSSWRVLACPTGRAVRSRESGREAPAPHDCIASRAHTFRHRHAHTHGRADGPDRGWTARQRQRLKEEKQKERKEGEEVVSGKVTEKTGSELRLGHMHNATYTWSWHEEITLITALLNMDKKSQSLKFVLDLCGAHMQMDCNYPEN